MEKSAIVFYPHIYIEKLQMLREKYDPLYEIIAPHITIVFPFSGIPEDKIIRHVQRVTYNFPEFSLRLNGFMKSFDNYLFLLVKEGNEEIVKLHEKLYSGVLARELDTSIPFIPHMTLGFFNNAQGVFDAELFHQAFAEAEEMDIDITSKCIRLSLIQGDGKNPPTTIQEFDLKA